MKLAIDPSFQSGEEGEVISAIVNRAVEQVLEEAYASGRESFLQFVEAYAPGKNDTVLEEMIEDFVSFSTQFSLMQTGWFEKTEGRRQRFLQAKDGWTYFHR
ncbi:MAG: hypothetical protein ACLTS6_16825 [Anaerobutyricum sp.]